MKKLAPFLAQSVGYLLNQAAEEIRRSTEEGLTSLAVSPRQLGLLSVIADQPGISQAEAARILRLDRTSAMQLTSHLESLGYVQRRSDPLDARKYALILSARGKIVAKQAQAIATKAGDALLSRLSPKEAADFVHVLYRLNQSRDDERY